MKNVIVVKRGTEIEFTVRGIVHWGKVLCTETGVVEAQCQRSTPPRLMGLDEASIYKVAGEIVGPNDRVEVR